MKKNRASDKEEMNDSNVRVTTILFIKSGFGIS
mgnify:CR=1 FL=1|jgi:hypothetical protein